MCSLIERQDGESRGSASNQTHIGRYVIKCDPHWHSWIHVGEQVRTSLPLPVCNAARAALDVTFDRGTLANQIDTRRIADLDARQLGFLEIAVHVEAIPVDQGEERFPGIDVIARPADLPPHADAK
jgi:hypothetical protein